MFLCWKLLPWTTDVILGLFNKTTTTSSTPPFNQILFWEICLIDLLVIFPLATILGQFYIRIAASFNVPIKPLTGIIPPSIYTTICQLIFADVILAGLLWSVSSTTTTSLMIFTFRFLTTCLGLAIGETFFPLALTGGIACGKSTISKMLRSNYNFRMIDADKIGHQILLPPWHQDFQNSDALVSPKDSVYVDILQAFASDNPNVGGGGDAIPGVNEDHPLLDPNTKCIDRLKLGAKVFANPTDRKKLNAITHKRIFYCLLKNLIQSLYSFGGGSSNNNWVCAEIPLLFESGPLRYVFGLAIVVACTPTQQLERLQQRNPELSPDQCQNRIDSQMPMSIKIDKADIIIWNDKDYVSSQKKDGGGKEGTGANNDDDGQQQALLSKQVEKAVQMIQHRVKGIMNISLTQMLILLTSVIMFRCWYDTTNTNTNTPEEL